MIRGVFDCMIAACTSHQRHGNGNTNESFIHHLLFVRKASVTAYAMSADTFLSKARRAFISIAPGNAGGLAEFPKTEPRRGSIYLVESLLCSLPHDFAYIMRTGVCASAHSPPGRRIGAADSRPIYISQTEYRSNSRFRPNPAAPEFAMQSADASADV